MIETLMQTYQDWNPLDFEHLCVSPGIIDLNVRRDHEDLTIMTQAALAGGVTLVVEEVEDISISVKPQTLYCDVGHIAIVSQPRDVSKAMYSGVFGFKAYLCQPNDRISSAIDIEGILDDVATTDLPLLIDPLIPDLRLYHLASPCHFQPANTREDFYEPNTDVLYASAFAGEAETSDQEDDIEICRPMRTKSTNPKDSVNLSEADLEIPTTPRERKMTDNFLEPTFPHTAVTIYTDLDIRIRANEQDIEYLSQLEQRTYAYSGATDYISTVPPPISPTRKRFDKFRPKPITVEKLFEENDKDLLYINYLANFPDHWETIGVKKILKACAGSLCKVHICNISSASAANAFMKKKNQNLTCDTATHFLGLTDSDVKRGDTRFKCTPPIRNKRNCNLLWELLKVKAIDMITSHHRAVPTAHKFLKEGSFKQAMSGISSLGYTLQQVWTKLRVPCASQEDMEHYLVRLAKWMSMEPAKLLGINDIRGSIEQGKIADFVIWDPYTKTEATSLNRQFPEVFPYTGHVFYGVIHSVIVKGNVAYEGCKAKPFGSFVERTR